MTKWIPTATTLILTIISANSDAIQTYISHHPQVAVILAAVYAIVKGLCPSPVTK